MTSSGNDAFSTRRKRPAPLAMRTPRRLLLTLTLLCAVAADSARSETSPPPEEEDVTANSLQRSLAVQGRIHRCRFGKLRNIS